MGCEWREREGIRGREVLLEISHVGVELLKKMRWPRSYEGVSISFLEKHKAPLAFFGFERINLALGTRACVKPGKERDYSPKSKLLCKWTWVPSELSPIRPSKQW